MNYLFPLIAISVWGGNAIVTKLSAGVIAPAEIAFYRWLLAVLLLTPVIAPRVYANRNAILPQLWRLVRLGSLGCALFPILLYQAAQYTSALHIGIIQALMPLVAICLSIALLGDRMTFGAAAGIVTSLAGVVIVVSHGNLEKLLARGPNLGDVIMLGAVICYATYSVLLRRWQSTIPHLQSLYVQGASAVLVLFPFYLGANRYGIDAVNAPLIAYAGGLASILGPLMWMNGIARLGPARTVLFVNLVPVVIACLAVPMLGEKLTTSLVLGGALTIAGVIIAELWRTPIPRLARVAPAKS